MEATMPHSLDSLKTEVDNHRVLQHQFLEKFRRGMLTKEQVKFWLVQQYFISVSLAQAFASVYAQIPSHLAPLAHKLVHLVELEAWGTSSSATHSLKFQMLASLGFGLEVKTAPPVETKMLPCTKLFINRRRYLSGPMVDVHEALACLALANEYLNLRLMQAYRDGICLIPGLEQCPTGYFDAHLRDEEEDFEVFNELYQLVCPGSQTEPILYHELLDARAEWFDGLWADIQKIRG